jgi:hypothetical protein
MKEIITNVKIEKDITGETEKIINKFNIRRSYSCGCGYLDYYYANLARDIGDPGSYVKISIGEGSRALNKFFDFIKLEINDSEYNKRIRIVDLIKENIIDFGNHFIEEYKTKYCIIKDKVVGRGLGRAEDFETNFSDHILISWEIRRNVYIYYYSKNLYHIACEIPVEGESSAFVAVDDYTEPYDENLGSGFRYVPINNEDKRYLDNFLEFIFSKNIKLSKYK